MSETNPWADRMTKLAGILEERGWRMDADVVRGAALQVSALQADVARLEGERDEARARVEVEKFRADETEVERAEARAQARNMREVSDRLLARLAAQSEVVEAAAAWAQAGVEWTDNTEAGIRAADRALAAVEKYQHPLVMVEVSMQDAPSSLTGTPQSDAEGTGVAQDVQETLGAQTGAQRACTCPWNNGYLMPTNPLGHHISCPSLTGSHAPDDDCARTGVPMCGHRDA